MLHPLSFTLPLAQLRPTTEGAAATAPAAAPAPAPAPALNNTGIQTATTQTRTAAPATSEPSAKPSFLNSLPGILPIVLMFVLLYLFMFRGQKKTEKTRKQMLANMKKGDEVMTIGGLVGRVVSLDDDEVVLKIDESANVKARYKKSAIQQVLTGEEKPSK